MHPYLKVVVSKDAPYYSIRFKWEIENILRHEAMLYPVEKRKTKEELGQFIR